MMIQKKFEKFSRIIALLVTLCFSISPVSGYCQSDSQDDMSAILAELKQLRAKVDEVEQLKAKVSVLENKVSSQQEIISRQEKALAKMGELVPAVKTAMAPPEQKVLVKNFILNGATLFDAKDFEPILAKYRNKEIGVSDLSKAAEEITSFYRSKGYITTLAYAPNQEISNNSVEFRIIEGQVGNIEIEKGEYYKKETIAKKFKVEQGEVLNYARLEENIKRINKQPDRTVKAVLSPGDEKGTSDILVKMEEERSPQHVFVEYSNRGTKDTGKGRFSLGYVNNNLFGRDDIFSIRGQVGENYDQVNALIGDYNAPINGYDTRLGIYGLYSHADVGGQFQIISPEGKAVSFGPYITHPLFDKNLQAPVSVNVASNVTLGFDWVSVDNRVLGQETSHDELRVPKIGIGFDEKDSMGRTFLSNELRVAVADFMGSLEHHDESASRLDAGGDFVKYTGSINRITRLPFSCLLISSAKWQFSDNPLVNSEQLSLGGANSIRGYPENDYLADYGWFSNFELRTPAFIFPAALKVPYDKKGTSIRDAVQFVYFADFGKGYLKKARVGEQRDDPLMGIGVGLRFDIYEHCRGRIDWGFPVGNEEPSDTSSSTVYIAVQCDL